MFDVRCLTFDMRSFDVQSLYLGSLLRRVFHVQDFYIQSFYVESLYVPPHHHREVMGSNPAGCWAFSLFCPLSSASLIKVPQGGATLLIFLRKNMLSQAAWGEASLVCMVWAKKVPLSHAVTYFFTFRRERGFRGIFPTRAIKNVGHSQVVTRLLFQMTTQQWMLLVSVY